MISYQIECTTEIIRSKLAGEAIGENIEHIFTLLSSRAKLISWLG